MGFIRLRYVLPTLAAIAIAAACSATGDDSKISGSESSNNNGGNGAASSGGNNSGGLGGDGAGFTVGGSSQGGAGGIFMNPCGTECGPTELCDGQNAGIDDDCDGVVDEGCPCTAGTAQACFKGDPSYFDDPGCFPGSQSCSEFGQWSECTGGVHATEMCFTVGQLGCHPISTPPFVPINLATGLGNFGMGAVNETWTVTCPAGVNPCPTPTGSSYTPLQSGEYSVLYEKTLANNMVEQCTYPLFVGAPGLRVELTWEWIVGQGTDTVDLDLHLHKPGDTQPWGGSSGTVNDCAYDNCTAFAFNPIFPSFNAPTWFGNGAPPTPVNWYLSPVPEENTCYYGPKGNGAEWQSIGQGCHNPRLDIDNVFCDPAVTDPQNGSFCNPENINIDYPPDSTWTRIGVNYYSSHSQSYNVYPVVKVFCDGALAAELGPAGSFGSSPVTFTPNMGASFGADNAFWLVADVAFLPADQCRQTSPCVVQPLYFDPNQSTPYIQTVGTVTGSFGPAYPPPPMP